MKDIFFKSITTYGDGSIAIQISKPIGKLTVEEDITTYGNTGNSLVIGVNVQLAAIALSIKPEGAVQEIRVKGSMITHGNNVTTYQVDTGKVEKIKVEGTIEVRGDNSKPILIENGGQTPVDGLPVKEIVASN